MGPGEFFTALLMVLGIPALTVVLVSHIRGKRPATLPDDLAERLEAVEQRVEGLQRELGETQERLDFTERMLSKVRDERRIEG